MSSLPDPIDAVELARLRLRLRHRRSIALSATLGAVVCAIAVVLALHAGSPPRIPTITIPATQQSGFVSVHNRVAPAFTLPSVNPDQPAVRLSTGHLTPVVVNFWSSTCVPCRQEMPAIARVAARLTGRVTFIGVDTLDSPAAGAAFARTAGAHYPLASDPDGSVEGRYGVSGLPTTDFISASNQIVGINLGAVTEPQLEQLLDDLFHIAH